MLKIRPTYENCNKPLAYNSEEAMICTFECAFCKDCIEAILQHIYPNCGGGFEKRPIWPGHLLEKYPVSTVIVYKLVNIKKQDVFIKKLKKPNLSRSICYNFPLTINFLKNQHKNTIGITYFAF